MRENTILFAESRSTTHSHSPCVADSEKVWPNLFVAFPLIFIQSIRIVAINLSTPLHTLGYRIPNEFISHFGRSAQCVDEENTSQSTCWCVWPSVGHKKKMLIHSNAIESAHYSSFHLASIGVRGARCPITWSERGKFISFCFAPVSVFMDATDESDCARWWN